MPQRQVVGMRWVKRRHLLGKVRQHPVHLRGEPRQGNGQRRERDWRDQLAGILVLKFGVWHTGFASERAVAEPQGVGSREDRPDRSTDNRDEPPHIPDTCALDERGEHRFFGDESPQRDDSRHRRCRDNGYGRQHRLLCTNTAELAHIASTGTVIDRADAQKERGFKECVREQHRRSGQQRIPAPETRDNHEEAEL